MQQNFGISCLPKYMHKSMSFIWRERIVATRDGWGWNMYTGWRCGTVLPQSRKQLSHPYMHMYVPEVRSIPASQSGVPSIYLPTTYLHTSPASGGNWMLDAPVKELWIVCVCVCLYQSNLAREFPFGLWILLKGWWCVVFQWKVVCKLLMGWIK